MQLQSNTLPKAHYTDGIHNWSIDSVVPDGQIPTVKCPVCDASAKAVSYEYPEVVDNRLDGRGVLVGCILLGVIVGVIICLYLDKKGLLK